jgi:hypothetical protein
MAGIHRTDSALLCIFYPPDAQGERPAYQEGLAAFGSAEWRQGLLDGSWAQGSVWYGKPIYNMKDSGYWFYYNRHLCECDQDGYILENGRTIEITGTVEKPSLRFISDRRI